MPPLPESARAAQPLTPAVCPNCADPLEAEDRFCGRCGLDLAAPPPPPAPAPQAPPPAPAAEEPDEEGDKVKAVKEVEDADGPATDSFLLAPPRPPAPAGGEHETLALGVQLPAARLSDPREEPPEPEGPVCVACGLGGVDDDGYCEHCGHAQPRQRDHQEQELAGAAAVTDRGLRHHRNEDAFTVAAVQLPDGTRAVAAVVCDGVSTAHRPDDASAAASVAGRDSLLTALEHGAAAEDAMRGALMSAFDAVTALAAEDARQEGPPRHNAPACTCVSAVVTGPVFTVGWIGDSRAYWIPDDRTLPPARLTEDDSWAARMVSAGLMTEAEAYADHRAHAITGWLGADAVEVDPHVAAFQPEGPGVVVVCTDGLWNYAESADEMAQAVPPDARTRPLHSARTLLGVALDGGGHDNVTVAVLPFPTAAAGAGTPPA
jgi:serine/threonine protein phosphatase PrpC